MFRKLQLQLTALCIAVTGLVLAILSCVCLYISESGIRSQAHASFLANLDTMYQNLEQQTISFICGSATMGRRFFSRDLRKLRSRRSSGQPRRKRPGQATASICRIQARSAS